MASGSDLAIDAEDDRHSAIHEAGHAVAAVLLGLGLVRVTVDRRRLPDGRLIGGDFVWAGVAWEDLPGQGDLAIPSIALYLAGPLAEKRVNPKAINPSSLTDDFRQALKMAEYAAGVARDMGGGRHEVATLKRDMIALYNKAHAVSDALVERHWEMLEALADQLQARRLMSGEEVTDFLRSRNHPAASG